MAKQLHIKCPQCRDQFKEDWPKVLQFRGIRPGIEWGIDKIRFYCLPIIYCIKCNCKCDVSLDGENIILQKGEQ